MALTLDIWSIPPESARRVGHPAPFPVELPEQLIRLYTFRDDLVLDPFMGSGSALVAAARLGRRYIGYDLDPQYVQIAEERVRNAAAVPAEERAHGSEGQPALRLAEEAVGAAGFRMVGRRRRIPRTGVVVDIEAADSLGNPWYFLVAGSFTSRRGGMARADVVWSMLGRAHALRGRAGKSPLILLTSELPSRKSEGDAGLRAAGPDAFFDAIDLLSEESRRRLADYAAGGPDGGPLPGFWTAADLGHLKLT